MLTIKLTNIEAIALLTMASEGSKAAINDTDSMFHYLYGERGAKAAKSSIKKIVAAIQKSKSK